MPKSILVTKAFEDISSIPKQYNVDQWTEDRTMPRDELLRRVSNKDALIVTPFEKIDAQLLDAAGSRLKVISTHSVGYDHIDVEECRKRGILLGNTPDVLTDAMAELTIALTLATVRRFPEAMKALQTGNWHPGNQSAFWMCGSGIKDSIVGFVGAGRIGKAIMKRLLPFEPSEMLFNTRNPNPELEKLYGAKHVSLEQVCQRSDILIVICSLNASTKQLIGAQELSQMKPSSVLINTSRGSVIDQDALYMALKNKQIAAAGLDVMVKEPIPMDDPLLALDNVVLLPHIGSAIRSTRQAMLQLAIDNALSGLEGRPLRAEIL